MSDTGGSSEPETNQVADCLDAALELHRRRIPITLCEPGTKKPLGVNWDDKSNGTNWGGKRWAADEIRKAFKVRGSLNLGVILGPSSGFIDFEVDSPEAEADLARLFDGCPPLVTPTFQSTRGRHRIFAWDPRLETMGKGIVKYGALEIRIGAGGAAAHSLLPPSTTDGTPRRWLVPLSECTPAKLPDEVVDRILEVGGAVRSEQLDVSKIHSSPSTPSTLLMSAKTATSAMSHDPALIERVMVAIEDTVPMTFGTRNARIFQFARQLKAIEQLAGADVGELEEFVRWWHERALPKIRTQPFEETWYDFRVSWRHVTHPAGSGPIESAFSLALEKGFPSVAENYEQLKIRQLIALCRELQLIAGDKPFFLTCRAAGALLGVKHMQAWRWLDMLIEDGVLIAVERKQLRRVNKYRYPG